MNLEKFCILICLLRFHIDTYLSLIVMKHSTTNSHLRDWITNFSGHGFAKLQAKENLLKLFWLISILLSICGCFWFITNSFLQYFSYSVVTTIKVEKKELLTFPAITFCGVFNAFNKSNNFEIEQVLSCQFDDISCIDAFEEIIVYASGGYRRCLQINRKKIDSPRKLLKTQKFGHQYGLKINMFLHKHQIALITIGDNFDIPVDGTFITNLKSGVQTDLTLKKRYTTNLGYPYNKCVKQGEAYNTELYKNVIDTGYNYRKLNCESLCFYKSYTEHCNCYLPGLNENSSNEIKPCIQYGSCYKNFSRSFNFNTACSDCPVECDNVEFVINKENFEIFYMDKPTLRRLYEEKNITSSKDGDLMERFLVLSVYFDDMKMMNIDQAPMETITNLISNIGGTLGLFLGLSLLSFVEIFELVVRMILQVKTDRQSSYVKKLCCRCSKTNGLANEIQQNRKSNN